MCLVLKKVDTKVTKMNKEAKRKRENFKYDEKIDIVKCTILKVQV